MRILAINSYQNNRCKARANNKKQIGFQAHPDFDKLAKRYEITASSFFRRGRLYGAPCSEFADVIRVFKDVFLNVDERKKMFIAGIGKSQEPFSYLAAIKSIIKDKSLEKTLDMNIVDLQSKPSDAELFKHSYFDYNYPPEFVPSSFVRDVRENIKYGSQPGYYRVKDDIYNFVRDVYNDSTKSKWETRVQDAVLDSASEDFDIVSINNTIGYIAEEHERVSTMEHVYRMLKRNGLYITDPYYNNVVEAGMTDKFINVSEGIYKKK